MFRHLFLCLGLVAAGMLTAVPARAQGEAETQAPAAAAAETGATGTTAPGDTIAKQAIIIDYDTGMVLLEKNADERMPTSSMSKTMTIFMVFDALKSGKISLDDMLTVSEKAWRMGGSKMFVKVGDRVRVEDLIRGVIVQSGNDATVVLAEGLRGSEEAFAEAATLRAKEMGMNGSNFTNASGWPDPNHYSTARDLATLGYHLIKDFPDYYHYYSEIEFTYNNIKQGNRNPLLYRNVGADGIKTGHTEAAGYGLMGSAVDKNGRRVVMVINGLASEKERAEESARLIEWAQKSFENITIYKAGEPVDEIPVVMGEKPAVPITLEQDVKITVPLSVHNDLKVVADYEAPLKAPVKKGQKVGTLTVNVPRGGTMELPLVAAEDVPHLGFFAGTVEKAKIMIGGAPRVE